MADPMMDFFDDPSLFVGGLDGLSEEGFTAGPVSLVDELNLGPEFESMQVDLLAAGKPTCLDPHSSSTSSHQGLTFGHQAGHFNTTPAMHPIGQLLPGTEHSRGCGTSARNQFHISSAQQVHQSNRLYADSSPMWGNQNHSGSQFHPLPQQLQQQQQGHHQHLNHHTQFQSSQQQSSAQSVHQHGKSFTDRSHYQLSFFPRNLAEKQQQQTHHNLPHASQLYTEQNEGPFHQRGSLSALNQPKSYQEMCSTSFSGGPEQQQNGMQSFQGGFLYPAPPANVAPQFPRSSAPASHSLPSCSVSSSTAYSQSPYSFPRQLVPDACGSPSSALMPAITNVPARPAALRSSAPKFLGAGDTFSLLPGMGKHQHQQQPLAMCLGGECPFPAMQAQGNYSHQSEILPEGNGCLPGTMSQVQSNQLVERKSVLSPASCSNGYQALDENLLAEAHSGGFEGLETPDLLGEDLLPQLEAALSQDTALKQLDESKFSWTNGCQGKEVLSVSLPIMQVRLKTKFAS
ncbi:hypothetical protein ANANG_G00102020 [Anguilla anguilla]|uniref:Chromodomain helicase DNA binding protein 9 n=1 Tax=Anguilla anguilla TaxID=7936 RepID=A0A9D3MGT6_ANGAN|nr:hypothetical protein ANANG_G00102020 [Anguilla anguilla]